MTPEMKTCKNCAQDFTIFPEDGIFYKKMHVPPPTWCPQCREMRRWSFRNERTLYSRNCDKCTKKIVSIWSLNKPQTVYCRECFNSDDFEPTAYGQDYDFSRPFFDQFKELLTRVPVIALIGGTNCVNSDYVNLETDDKNCYMNVGGHFNEDCYYNTFSLRSKNCVDNYWVFNCELMYECLYCYFCYHCFYSQNLISCNDCWFCYDCRNCTNCFGCVNQRSKQFMIFNRQYSKEEYEKRIAELTSDRSSLQNARALFNKERLRHPHRFAFMDKTEDATGNYLTQSKNVRNGFDCNEVEDSSYIQIAERLKDCMDCSAVGWAELVYESLGAGWASNAIGVGFAFPGIHFSYYSLFCSGCDYLFGCVSMKKNKYCILNKQYTEQEYEGLVPKIINHMRETREWGEFFPTQISPFGYNETVAYNYFRLTKDEASAKGYQWQVEMPEHRGSETIKVNPVSIESTSSDITKEIFACEECGNNYKIIRQELDFYRKMHLPLPCLCPTCRHEHRLALRGASHELHRRQCMCDKPDHDHSSRCPIEFETMYASDRSELVYCESCYQKEVI